MKKLIVFLILVFVNLCGFARNNTSPTPKGMLSGDTILVCTVPVCSGTTESFHLFSSFGFQTSCSYSCQGVRYYITEPYIVVTFNVPNDTTIMCYVDSVNGLPLNKVKAIAFSISVPPTISIPQDSIHHVTCPDGWDYPYADGMFYVSLDDSVQNYAWINIISDSLSFFTQTYDAVMLTGLRSGVYHVIVHGMNGCEYHDSVTIEQPDPWVDYGSYFDTVCPGTTGCMEVGLYGGTPPYNFTWFYYEELDNEVDTTIFLEDTTRYVCGLYPGKLYHAFMYDSKGCKVFGEEMFSIAGFIYQYVEDSIHLITTNTIACYDSPFLAEAQSIGYGDYVWHVGDSADSVNWWIWVAADSVLIADFYTPPMTEPTLVSVDFYDQHGCVTHDSIWVDIYNPGLSLSIETQDIVTDSTCVIHVSPLGGSLYLDGMLIVENVPDPYTLSTSGISVGDHTLKYAGVFGMEQGLYCEEEVEVSFNVQSHPFVTDWDQEISIYPNPATTTLNLSGTETMDFMAAITDITGKVIRTENILSTRHAINVSDLSSGIYLLRLQTPTGATKTVKFVKK